MRIARGTGSRRPSRAGWRRCGRPTTGSGSIRPARPPARPPTRTGSYPRTSPDRGYGRRAALDPGRPAWKPAPVTEVTAPAAGPGADRALRRERFGWYSYDWGNSVFYTSVVTVFLAPYLTSIAKDAADAAGRIHPLGISVPPGSFFGYVLSFATILQVLVLPLTGAIADRSGHKKQLLAGFAALGSLATVC